MADKTAPKTWDYYIAYASQDASDIASLLEGQLRRRGARVFRDRTALPPGSHWAPFTTQAMAASGCVVALVSQSTVQSFRTGSSHQQREVLWAINNEVPVVPVLLGWMGLRVKHLPQLLADRSALTMEEGNDKGANDVAERLWHSRDRLEEFPPTPSGPFSVVLLEKGPANWHQFRESVERRHLPFDEALRSAFDHPPALLDERLTREEALSWLRELESLGARATVFERTEGIEAPRFHVSRSRIAWMRAPAGAPGSDAPRPFSLMAYPVEQALYQSVMGTNPSRIQAPDFPVTDVTWDDARRFCERLTRREGLVGEPYRLPTEKEWVYAARAGQPFEDAGSKNWSEVAWCDMSRPAAVGKGRTPNEWGLFDMCGNVWERVEEPHVVCGGSFRSHPADLRVNSRRAADPAGASEEIGFRVARTEEVNS